MAVVLVSTIAEVLACLGTTDWFGRNVLTGSLPRFAVGCFSEMLLHPACGLAMHVCKSLTRFALRPADRTVRG